MFERSSLAQLAVDVPSLRIDAANKAFCALTGFSGDEVVGSDLALAFPADADLTADIAERVSDATSSGYSVERCLQCRDGTVLPVTSTVSICREDGVAFQLLLVLQDLTDQRVAERAQRRGQAVIDAAVATLPVAFSTFDRDLRLSFVAGGREVAGVRPEDYLGKRAADITDDPEALVALRSALSGSESTWRTVVNGRTYLNLSAPIREGEGGIVGVVSVSSDITAEVSAEAERRVAEELRLFVALHDPLTGLMTRTALVEHLNTLTCSEQGARTLLLIDIDGFSLINDGLGHELGDAVLVEVASRLSNAFPASVIARHGGDEFAVLAPLAGAGTEAVEAAERVRAALDRDVQIGPHALRITASVGVALEQSCGSTPTLIRNADLALLRAKDAGAGQFRVYDAEMHRQARERVDIQNGLRMALQAGQLRVAYQPIVRLIDGCILGSEALLRWTHPLRGEVSPVEFIPIAERCGLIVPIGHWVMNAACVDLLPLHRDYGITASVNVSVRQLTCGDCAEWVEDILEHTGLPSCALTIEVTESALMDDLEPIRMAFARLRSQGVKVAIDDFGTGYSSLARLQRLPIDTIKLDRAFVAGIDSRPAARGMAAAILQLSAAIGASVIAEGVETEAEASTLGDLGYTTAQGYLFGRPMPIGDLTTHLRARSNSQEPS